MSKPSHNGQDPKSEVDHKNPIRAEEGYIQLPRWVRLAYREGHISAAERDILEAVADQTLSWGRPLVRLTNADLADLSGLSEPWARKKRDELVEKGYLVQHRSGQTYEYGLKSPESRPQEEIRKILEQRLNGSTTVEK